MRFQKLFFHTIALMLACLLNASCSPHSSDVSGIETTEISIDQTTHLFQDEQKPAAHEEIRFTYITDVRDERMRDSLNRIFVEKTFGEKYRQIPAEEAPSKYADDYAKTYRNDLESSYLEDEKTTDSDVITSWYSYEESIQSAIERYQKNTLLVYRVNMYAYTGGVHGMHGTFYTNIDLHNLRIITLSDLFKSGYEEPLTNLICEQLMKDVEVESLEELEDQGFGPIDEIKPTENFVIYADSIEFLYNVYEIAPYAYGAISVVIPYETLRPLLNTDYLIVKKQL